MRLKTMLRIAAVGMLVSCAAGTSPAASLPSADQNLVLQAPITTWDEAVPLGNGLMGGLLWGEDNRLRLSLDRGDLWDERPAVEREWWKTRTYARAVELVARREFDTVANWWDSPYNGTTPTKLPAGRLEIALDRTQSVERFELDLATAEGIVHLAGGDRLGVIFSAAEPVALLRIPGPEPTAIELIPAGARTQGGDAGPSSGGAVAQLGYPPAVHGRDATAVWYVQEAAEGLKYCVCVDRVRAGNETLLAVAVTSTNDSPAVLELARNRCAAAVGRGYDALRKPHVAWWEAGASTVCRRR